MAVSNQSNTHCIEQVWIDTKTREREFYYVDLVENTRTLFVGSPLLKYGASSRPYIYWINDDYFIASSFDSLYGCGIMPIHQLYNKNAPSVFLDEYMYDVSNKRYWFIVTETKIVGNELVLVYSDHGTLDEWGIDYAVQPQEIQKRVMIEKLCFGK